MPFYLLKCSKDIVRSALESSIFLLDANPSFTYLSGDKALIETEKDIDAELESSVFSYHEKWGMNLSFLRTHNANELARHLLDECFAFYPNSFRYLSDILFKQLTFGNYASIPLLYKEFRYIDKELLLTAGEYLRSGLDGKKAAKKLFIHRNTFLYRMNKFKELTHLDIRLYHDALLLELYFQMASH